MSKGNGTGVRKQTWNNVQRVNKQNQFVPLAVQTRTGTNPVNAAKASSTNNFSTARQSVNRQTVLTSTALKVNTVQPMMSDVRSANVFHKTNSPSSRPFKRTTVLKTNLSNQKGYTAKDNPHRNLQNKGIIDSGCSRHMTGNKAYLADYQDINGGPVAFGGSKGYITGKGKIKTGIKREYSNARTPQQNGVAERKNRTLIEAARTMLADSFLPNTFWAEAVSTACYVLNRVLVTKPQNKTPYELVTGKIPIISYIRPFGCHVTILNTIDHLGKFDGKSDEGFLVGYSLQSKAFRVYNLETKRVEENLHITFLENKPNVAGKGPTWLFDLDYLTDSMNYQPVRSENQANKHAGPQEANQNAGTEDNIDAGDSAIEAESAQDYFVLPIWSSYTSTVKSSKANNAGEEPTKHPDFQQVDKEDQVFLDELERLKRQEQDANDAAEALRKEFAQETEDLLLQAGAAKASSTNIVNTASTPVSTADPNVVNVQSYSNIRIKLYLILHFNFGDPQSAVQTRTLKDRMLGLMLVGKKLLPVQDSESLDSCRFALWEEGYWNKIVDNSCENATFLYGKIDEEVYVSQPPGFIDPKYPQKVYKVVKALYGLHQAPRACVKQKEYGIFISQDKYVAEILKKFDFVSVKTASTPIETQKPLVKDEEASDVDVHLYRSMIGSLMYLTASRPDIMFAVSKGANPTVPLWYLKVFLFDMKPIKKCLIMLGSKFDKKSTTGGLSISPGRRLISWQCKKQTIMATSTTEAEYVAAANCCGQVLDAYEKKLIQVLKIHTDDNVADLLTKAFDVSRISVLQEALLTISVEFQEVNWVFKSHWEEIKTMSAKSKIINNVRYITAKVAGKPVSISEASIRSDLLFDDADGIDSLPNQAIFDAIQLIEVSGRNHGGQSSSNKSLSGNEGGMTLQSVYDLCISLCTQVTNQAKKIKHLKAQIKKLKKQAPVITHHRAWMKSVSLKQRLAGKKSLKSNWMQKESVSKQGRKSAKTEPLVHKDPLFDELDDDEIDNIDTEDAQDVGRTRNGVNAEKEDSTDKEKDSTDKEKEGTDKDKDSTVSLDEGTNDRTEARSATSTTPTTTPTMFGDDENYLSGFFSTLSQAKAVSSEKEKGIDPKDKGKKKIKEEDESDTESEDIPEAEKKFKQLARDEEMARKLQEDWETEERKKKD
ncbi:putative ribonuclease H-like domain-containing protein [Tanacetum coccineum]